MDSLDHQLDAVRSLLCAREPDLIAQGIELVRAAGPPLRDAVLARGGLTHRVTAAIVLRCGGAAPPWVHVDLPFHRGDLARLHEHPEITSLTIFLLSGADAEGIVLPLLPPALQRLTLRGPYTGTWTLSLSEQALPALTSLGLSNARLASAPAMPALTSLDLRACPGEALAPLLSPRITSLNMVASTSPVPPFSLAGMAGLRQLHLDNVGLEAVPAALGAAGRLEVLNLANNQIAALPEAIGALSALRELVLSNNPLAVLPPAIGRLQALQQLRLAACPLAALPPEVGMLGALRRLSLRHTQVSALPEALSKLPHLSRLDISGTPIPALPPQGLPALRTLAIRDAALDLDRGGPLPALRWLHVGSAGEALAREWVAAEPARACVEIRR